MSKKHEMFDIKSHSEIFVISRIDNDLQQKKDNDNMRIYEEMPQKTKKINIQKNK